MTIKNRDIFKFKDTIRTLIIYLCHFFTQIKNTTNEKTINNLTFKVLVLPAIGVCDCDKKKTDLEERTSQSKLILVVAIILRRHRWMEMTKLGHEFGLVWLPYFGNCRSRQWLEFDEPWMSRLMVVLRGEEDSQNEEIGSD